MIVKRQCAVVSLGALLVLVLSANVYFVYIIVDDTAPYGSATSHVSWVNAREVMPAWAPQLGSMLHTLCSSRILHADNALQGTQLKLILTLAGGQRAIFKPQWYSREAIIQGPVYAGKDRHNAEVAAFHLSLALGLRRCPLTVGRKLNLRRELIPVASDNLLDTFYQEGNNTCFYGVCYYCSPQDPVCAQKDVLEGALIMWLSPGKLKKLRSPWQRTYKAGVAARWELDEQYCDKVKASKLYRPDLSPRLLDLVDTALFDFLIDNGDRHHYEVFDNWSHSAVLLLDNGKSFGNPHLDHVDILAPLYQCCILRKSTWQRLRQFSGGVLGSTLGALLEHSHISPVLAAAHLRALDRRLMTTFAAVEQCFSRYGRSSVLLS
ncbi:glycosaminoglycan xylosylkinase isoform X3 [Bacillus rossius redtenbacheri]|uniref:glycosaminoglycan xylosylkinase isoform X3 n=1 Tax=Bacillus rossius redtenbacheri TaxID=93214 RepID=UPI002FDD7AD3